MQAKKQHPYTSVFKANVTHQVGEGFFQDEVAKHFNETVILLKIKLEK